MEPAFVPLLILTNDLDLNEMGGVDATCMESWPEIFEMSIV